MLSSVRKQINGAALNPKTLAAKRLQLAMSFQHQSVCVVSHNHKYL